MWKGLFLAWVLNFVALSIAQTDSGLALSSVAEYSDVPIFEQTLSVVVSFEAPGSVADTDRSAVSVTAVLDRSGSMSGSKIDLLRRSTEFLVDRLTDGDYVGVVSYSSDVSSLIDSTVRSDISLSPITDATKSQFREIISGIEARGSTNLGGGLFEGIDQQTQADIAGTVVKAVVLFTDGLANTGVTDIGSITSRMRTELSGERPPTVYTLGFGGDHDASYLQAIAEEGRGNYVFVSDANAIAAAIGEVLGGLLSVTAQNIVIDFEPLNGARIISIRGGSVSGDNTRTTFPDLFAEERRDILVNMGIPVLDNALEDQEILRVTMTYFDTITEQTEVKTTTVVIDRSLDVVETRPASVVERTRLRYRVADDLETAVAQREAGDTEGASATLDGTLTALEGSSEAESAEVQALTSDVLASKEEVEKAEFEAAEASRITGGATSLTSGRASAGAGFSSLSTTTAQAEVAGEADAFVGRR